MNTRTGGGNLLLLCFLGLLSTGAEALYKRQGRHARGTHRDVSAASRRLGNSISARKLAVKNGGKSGGGKSGGGKGGGSSSLGWMGDEYYGCLALSQQELAELRSSGQGLDCDYVLHVEADTSRTGGSSNSDSDSSSASSNADTADYTISYSYNNSESNGSGSGNEDDGSNADADGSDYTISYSYNDDTSSSGNGQQSNGESSNADGSDYTISYSYNDDGSDSGNGNQDGGDNANADANNNSNAYANNDNESGNGESAVSENKDGNEVVSAITDETDPYNAFDIIHCDTYEHLWTWDLELSCGNTTNYTDCHCTFAESLMEKGMLSCEDSQNCPRGCSICSNCLRLLGCEEASRGSIFSGSAASSATATVAAVFTLLVGTGCCMVMGQKRKGKPGKLNDHLIDDTKSVECHDKIWMVPIDNGVPTETGSSTSPVWLVPDGDSVSVDASSTTSSVSGMKYAVKGKASRGMRHARFPDLLGPALGTSDQVFLPRRVPTVPTDVTSHSGGASSEQSRRSHQNVTRRTYVGNGVWLLPEPSSRVGGDEALAISVSEESLHGNSTESSSNTDSASNSSYTPREPRSDYASFSSTLTNSHYCEDESM